MFDFIMPKLNLLNELQFLLRNLAATPVPPPRVLFSRSFFPVQCMMFKATYSPADANNKRKETKWADIFSMQMSVEIDGLEEPDSSHKGAAIISGALGWGSLEMPKGICLRPEAWSIHQSWN